IVVIGQDASADAQHHWPVPLYQNLKRRLAVVGDKTLQEDPIVLSAQGTHLLKCSHAAKHIAELAVRHETLRNWFPVHPLKCSEQRNGYTIFSSSMEMQRIEAMLSGGIRSGLPTEEESAQANLRVRSPPLNRFGASISLSSHHYYLTTRRRQEVEVADPS